MAQTDTTVQHVKPTTAAQRKAAAAKRQRIAEVRQHGWPDILTVAEAAKYIRRDRCTLYADIRENRLPRGVVVKFGTKTIRVIKAKLDEFMADGGVR